MDHWNDDEYSYQEAPASGCDGQLDEGREEIHAIMEWGEHMGLSRMMRTREGANFIRIGSLWIIPLMGGQPIHHDRHILSEENGSNHTWNIVCCGEGDQMLVTEVEQDMFNHMPLVRGSAIYLNTLNRHLVSRTSGREVCVLIQHAFPDRPEPQKALDTMIAEWRRVTSPDFDPDASTS